MTETCEICGDTFESERGLHIHQSQVHPESEHICPVCGDDFDSERGLHIHQSQVHEKDEGDEKEDQAQDKENDGNEEEKDQKTQGDRLSEKELVQIVGGGIEHLENFLEEERSIETLKRLLEDEKLAQDREKAKKILQEAINQKEFGKDFDQALEELDQMKLVLSDMKEKELGERSFDGDELDEIEPMTAVNLMEGDFSDMKEFLEDKNPSLDQIDDLIEAESNGKERNNVMELLKSTKHQKRLFVDIEAAKESINEVETDLNDIMKESSYVHPKSLEDYGPHKKVEEEETEKSDLRDKLSSYGYSDDELKELDTEDLETLLDAINEKKDIIEDLEVDFEDEELSDVDLENLKDLKEEREEREKLIDSLVEKGMDEKMLRDSSTPDLRKLDQSTDSSKEDDNSNQEPSEGSESEEDERDEEEIEREAEEDLEMLMGAVKSVETEQEEEDETTDTVEQLKDYKENIQDIFSRGSETEKEGQIRDKEVIELLEEYRDLDDMEKAIKTAHVMKGYLEFKMNIPQELTYHQLASELEERDIEDMKILTEFFEKMAEDQYLEKISIENLDQVIEASEQTAKNMG